MSKRECLPDREHVFMMSLMYHGFRITSTRTVKRLKKKKGYIIPSTRKEDEEGIDFWVKMPGKTKLWPVQVTQRGIKLFKKYHRYTDESLAEFCRKSEIRLKRKRQEAKRSKVVFVLVSDFSGKTTNKKIAWGDIKALRHAINSFER